MPIALLVRRSPAARPGSTRGPALTPGRLRLRRQRLVGCAPVAGTRRTARLPNVNRAAAATLGLARSTPQVFAWPTFGSSKARAGAAGQCRRCRPGSPGRPRSCAHLAAHVERRPARCPPAAGRARWSAVRMKLSLWRIDRAPGSFIGSALHRLGHRQQPRAELEVARLGRRQRRGETHAPAFRREIEHAAQAQGVLGCSVTTSTGPGRRVERLAQSRRPGGCRGTGCGRP